jgi:starch synthase
MIASEATPFAKTGGLADVLGSLPQALVRQGVEAAVILPRYRTVSLDGAEKVSENLALHPGWMTFNGDIWQRDIEGVPYFLVDCPPLFDRDGIYGNYGGDFGDNHIRFAALCHAAFGVGRRLFRPEIIHMHDWQAGLAAIYLHIYYSADPLFHGLKSIMTIHNLGYQGRFPSRILSDIGVPREMFRPDTVEFYGDVNLLKTGIVYADRITTVSPTYAKEIQTPEFGEGLDGLLRARTGQLHGILNGCDYSTWNPEVDPLIPARYSANDLSGKKTCKRALLEEFGLPADDLDTPVVGIVSRFAKQKGFDLIAAISGELYDIDLKMVVLGSGDPEYQQLFRRMAEQRPEKFGVKVAYDERVAHLVEAGSDLFLMPSLYEPCGLNQMYSLRYGTLPLVRATGGLADTVDDETGFLFWGYESGQLLNGLLFALDVYRNQPEHWRRMMRTAMSRDYSWDASAREYAELYGELLAGPAVVPTATAKQ